MIINFKLKDSFLIGELQLALGNSTDERSNDFCHYLYELQRGILPVMFEVSNQLVSFDSKVNYFNNTRCLEFKRGNSPNLSSE